MTMRLAAVEDTVEDVRRKFGPGEWEPVDDEPTKHGRYWQTPMVSRIQVADDDPRPAPRGYRDERDPELGRVWIKRSTRLSIDSVSSEITVDRDTFRQAFGTPGIGTGLHEFCHRTEALNPMVGAMEAEFIRRRTVGKWQALEQPVRIARGEKARPDGFVHPYIGKVYPNHDGSDPAESGVRLEGQGSPFEVMSVGVESVFAGVFGGLAGVGEHKADADHRNFVLGVLATV